MQRHNTVNLGNLVLSKIRQPQGSSADEQSLSQRMALLSQFLPALRKTH